MSSFKNRGLGGDELRRRREDVTIEIRKQKKEESLAKRRNLSTANNQHDSQDNDEASIVAAQVNLLFTWPSILFTDYFIYLIATSRTPKHGRWCLLKQP